MAAKYQAGATPLSAKDYQGNEHRVSQFSITQTLSAPFSITAILHSGLFDPEAQLGQKINISSYGNHSGQSFVARVYNGIITNIRTLALDSITQSVSYEVTVTPWFELLKHTHAFRIYQNKSTQEIITDIFDSAGFSGSYEVVNMSSEKREYCQQYNESDFDFVCRLLAEDGVNYFFVHSEDEHVLMLQEAQSPFEQAPQAKFDMAETPSGSLPLLDSWSPEMAFHGASVELTAYDYGQTKVLSGNVKRSSHSIANHAKLSKKYHLPLEVASDKSVIIDHLSQLGINQLEQNYHIITATAKHDLFTIATWFSLASHHDKSQLAEYNVVSLKTHYLEKQTACSTEVKVVPKATPYYPEPLAKPKIYGLLSGTVAGANDGEVNQDEQGRVQVHFHWDTQASGDKTSCYVRVAQMIAGNGYGAQFIPRTGQEVLVSFIDGDPDQPIITGSVYNSNNKPPYREANSSKSGIKTMLEGLSNELSFDDKKDNELIYCHAAKDFNQEVENNQLEVVKGELSQKVTKKIEVTTEDNYDLKVTKTLSEQAKVITIEAEDRIELCVGTSKLSIGPSSIGLTAKSIDIKAENDLTLDGTSITSAAKAMHKTTGANTLVESRGLNKIQGMSVEVNADTTLTANGALSAEFKSGLKATFNGGVMGEVKGAIVKVN